MTPAREQVPMAVASAPAEAPLDAAALRGLRVELGRSLLEELPPDTIAPGRVRVRLAYAAGGRLVAVALDPDDSNAFSQWLRTRLASAAARVRVPATLLEGPFEVEFGAEWGE